MSQGDIKIKQKWFKGYHNQKVRNLSMKNSNSDDYDENVEVVNTSGSEWKPVYGNDKDTQIPNVLLPERKRKKTQFIRISSSNPKIEGGSIHHLKNTTSLYYMDEISKKYDADSIKQLFNKFHSSRTRNERLDGFTNVFSFLSKRPLLLFNHNFLVTAEKKVEEYKSFLKETYNKDIPDKYRTTLYNMMDIISQVKNGQLDKSKVVQQEYDSIMNNRSKNNNNTNN